MNLDTLKIYNKLIATLGVVTQNVKARHWTLRGDHFKSWHLAFDEIYELLAKGTDTAAELVVQRGEVPTHSLEGYLKRSMVSDMQAIRGWEEYVADTRDELKVIIDFINDNDRAGVFDGAASNDLTQLASDLYHWYMFALCSLE